MKANKIRLFFVNLFEDVFCKIFNSIIGKIADEKWEKQFNHKVGSLEMEIESVKAKLTPKKVKEILDPSLCEIEEKGLKIRMKTFMSDPDMKTFYINLPCWKDGRPDFHIQFPFVDNVEYYASNGTKGGSSEYTCKPSQSMQKFIQTIFASNCVSEICAKSAFEIIITKPGSLTWNDVTDKINEAIASLFPEVTNVEDLSSK